MSRNELGRSSGQVSDNRNNNRSHTARQTGDRRKIISKLIFRPLDRVATILSNQLASLGLLKQPQPYKNRAVFIIVPEQNPFRIIFGTGEFIGEGNVFHARHERLMGQSLTKFSFFNLNNVGKRCPL